MGSGSLEPPSPKHTSSVPMSTYQIKKNDYIPFFFLVLYPILF